MTGKELVFRALERKSVQQLPFCEALWGETIKRWTDEGHLKPDEKIYEHFNFDLFGGSRISSIADVEYKDEIINEDEEFILFKDGNGATKRMFKKTPGPREYVNFSVKDRQDWEEKIKPHLSGLDRKRIPFEDYRNEMEKASDRQLFHTVAGLAPFEQMHPVCGHENLLIGMALDPAWIKDMVETYVNLTINHLEELFSEEGLPDAAWLSEDLGYKNNPFISPQMYKELLMPGHKKLFGYLHGKGLKVIVHSCGFIEPLVPGLIEAGMDCLQAMEVKAGMDLPRLFKKFGQQISFCGNIDVRVLLSNDKNKVEQELKEKILPVLGSGGGYILHSDHSIPPQVDYETFAYFVERGRMLPELLGK